MNEDYLVPAWYTLDMEKIKKINYCLLAIILILIIVIIGMFYFYDNKQGKAVALIDGKANNSYIINIIKETENNNYFRRVLFTGTRSQLVIMNIPSGGEVGEETHIYTEQTLFFLSGTGKAILDGKESMIGAGDVVVVTPGTRHNFVNTGTDPLNIYTVYAPANHIDGRVHVTKDDADKDVLDEAYGNQEK